jgi:hypothetical protein
MGESPPRYNERPVSSTLKQVTLKQPQAGWQANNITVATVPGFSFPLSLRDLSDPFQKFLLPELPVRGCWYNDTTGRIYVDFAGGSGLDLLNPAATTLPYYGVVQFDLDGSNPRVVYPGGFASFADPVAAWNVPGNRVALGWGCRSDWEL